MNTKQTSKNIFTYTKTHYSEAIQAKIRKLEKTMIACSSYTNQRRCGVVVISTVQLYSTKYKLRFCAGSNSARCVSGICDCENL